MYSYKPLKKLSRNREVEVSIGHVGFKATKYWRFSTRQEGERLFRDQIARLKSEGYETISHVAGHGYMQAILKFGITHYFVDYSIVEA